jgi:hypothetical protein
VHLIVEADDKRSLARGIAGLAIRMARATNRVLHRRGAIWSCRYHARALTTPREVRNALVYVVFNLRKHAPRARGWDVCSSAPWLDGWEMPPTDPPFDAFESPPVRKAETWLARTGWKRHGLIRDGESPKAKRPRRWTSAHRMPDAAATTRTAAGGAAVRNVSVDFFGASHRCTSQRYRQRTYPRAGRRRHQGWQWKGP